MNHIIFNKFTYFFDYLTPDILFSEFSVKNITCEYNNFIQWWRILGISQVVSWWVVMRINGRYGLRNFFDGKTNRTAHIKPRDFRKPMNYVCDLSSLHLRLPLPWLVRSFPCTILSISTIRHFYGYMLIWLRDVLIFEFRLYLLSRFFVFPIFKV